MTSENELGDSWVYIDDNVQWVAANEMGEIWAVRNGDELFQRVGVSPD